MAARGEREGEEGWGIETGEGKLKGKKNDKKTDDGMRDEEEEERKDE